MFDLILAKTVRQRMRELSKFIDFWYGPSSKQFEIRDSLDDLPLPLQLFYKHHGKRPPLRSDITTDNDYFYEGAGGHHLFQPKHLGFRSKGRVKFFMEYQGDFDGYCDREGSDPRVLLRGLLPAHEFEDDDYGHHTYRGEGFIEMSLSRFLVTHVLLTTLYEPTNHRKLAYRNNPICKRFRNARGRKMLIWDAGEWSPIHCTHYFGKIYLFADSILVHEFNNEFVFASNSLKKNGDFRV